MPFYNCQPGGVKHIDLDLGQVYLTKDKDNDIALSYDNNVFIQATGIELVLAYPVTTWENAMVCIINRTQNNHIHLNTSCSQKYHIIVRVYYQNPHPV
jgi:hypothetical protein